MAEKVDQVQEPKGIKLHKVGKSRRDVMRALARFPAFKETAWEAWAVRFEHLVYMSKFTDGELDHQRFDRFCKLAIGMKSGTSEFLFKCFDKDGSGSISASEFISAVTVVLKGTLQQKLDMAFSAYDVNGDGIVDLEELYAGMMAAKGLTVDDFNAEVSAHVKTVLHKIDKNHDGQISKKEFMAAVMGDKRLVDELGLWMRTSTVLSEPQYDMLKSLFNDIDQDNSGRIEMKEMAQFAKMCLPGKPRLAEKKAKHIMRSMDEKGYDGVDFEEWIKYFETMYAGKPDDAVTKAIIAMRNSFKA